MLSSKPQRHFAKSTNLKSIFDTAEEKESTKQEAIGEFSSKGLGRFTVLWTYMWTKLPLLLPLTL